MKPVTIAAALSWAVMTCAPAIGLADKVDFGKREYDSNCAVCHGLKGKGDGPYAGMGNQSVRDLTVLSKKNGGVFPIEHVYEVIDGREQIKAHGPRDMPIWGTEYSITAAERYGDVGGYSEEAYIRAHILLLVDYIYRLQVK